MNGSRAKKIRRQAYKLWFDATHSGMFAKDKVAPLRRIYRRLKRAWVRKEVFDEGYGFRNQGSRA